MQARNKLVIVRDADEALRIPLSKRLKVKLTQSMSDQLVLAEISGFVKAALRLRKQNLEEAAAGLAGNTAGGPLGEAGVPAFAGGAADDAAPSAKRQRTDPAIAGAVGELQPPPLQQPQHVHGELSSNGAAQQAAAPGRQQPITKKGKATKKK